MPIRGEPPAERAALLWKFSHALGDGVGVLRIALGLLDLEPDPPRAVPASGQLAAAGGKSRAALLLDRMIELPVDLTTDAVRTSLWAASAGLRVAADPRAAAGEAVGFARSLRRLVTPPPAAPSPALRARGTRRRLLTHEVPLEQLKRAGRAGGGSVNDAYLAGGARRDAALSRGARRPRRSAADGGCRSTAVPERRPGWTRRSTPPAEITSVRSGSRAPVAEADPAERMRQVHELVLAGRSEPAHGATDAVARVFGRTPAVLLAEIARQQGHLDLQASNVAGFPGQVYLAGVPVNGMFSFGPAPGVAVMFVMVSYAGTCGIGITLDESAIAHPELFAECVRAGFDEGVEARGFTCADVVRGS